MDVRTPVAAAVATLLGALALGPVFASGAWLRPAMNAVLVVLVTGLVLRAAGSVVEARVFRDRPLPEWLAAVGTVLVPVGQLAALFCWLTARFASEGAFRGVVPTGTSVGDLVAVLADGADEIREQAAPALPVTGLLALVAVFVGLVAVLVDLVAVAGRQGAVAGLALLALFCVPVFTLTGGIGLLAVIAPASGLALLLWADQARRVTGTRAGVNPGAGPAARIGLVALLVGLVGGGLLPTLSEGWFTRDGDGDAATGTALSPMATMAGQLSLPDPVDLLRLETSVEDPGYLRAVTIDHYDATDGWSLTGLSAQRSLDEELPVDHPDSVGRPVTVTVTVEALAHDDRFLPVPVSPTEVRMVGGEDGWWFDPTSGTVVGHRVSTENLRYEVTATEVRPSTDLLAATPPLDDDDPIQQRYTSVGGIDQRVNAQVAELVAGAGNGYERVRRILDFFTDRRNGFRYTLSTKPGTSGDDLVDFLVQRQGYCEQYAGAMAVMVRSAGMPARVALGYTPGTVQDDGSRVITTDDAHAWVEVYFDGVGWVPFDPTPIDLSRRADLPWAPRVEAEEGPDVAAALPAPLPEPFVIEGLIPEEDLNPGEFGAAAATGVTESRTGLAAAGVALMVAVAGALPGGLRLLQRRRRLADGSATALWDELTATADDLGLTRNPAWTPREAGRAFAERTADGPAAEAVGRLAGAEERASYGPATPGRPDGLDEDLRTARRALIGSVERRDRLRAAFWPASLFAGVRAGLAGWSQRRPRLLELWGRGARRV